MLSPEKIKQIEADSENVGLDIHEQLLYIAGATAEAEKAAGLVEALKIVRKDGILSAFKTLIDEALNNYNQ